MDKRNTVLIVDDSNTNLQTLALVLEDDYNTKLANSGAVALETVQSLKENEEIDLILLDVGMPEMDGYAVLHALGKNPKSKHIPVIFVTGNDSTQDEEKGLAAGAVDYITKPIHPAIVKARVKIQMTIKMQRDALQYSAMHDMLTGLYNRHHLSAEGTRKFAKALRHGSQFSVIMVDIDHFKDINDTYGHFTGDEVLKAVANVLNSTNRVEDFVARFGGEEFVILLEDCSFEHAKEKAENFRKHIEELMPEGIKVTCSFGLTTMNQKYHTLEEMLKDADKALFRAKEDGRNRVVAYE